MTTAINKSRLARKPKPETKDPILAELEEMVGEIQKHIRTSCFIAVRIGLRLMHLRLTLDEDAPGGFRGALEALDGLDVHRSTAYRWINAASAAVMRIQGVTDVSLIDLPTPGSKQWDAIEDEIKAITDGASLARLIIGSAAPSSDEARLDNLITQAEAGDPHADACLEKIYKGEMTLVQAIRAQAGAAATKSKNRKDPVYLDIDGTTGQPTGLVPKCFITLSRAFATWDSLDETARHSVKSSWKALIATLPSELR